MFHHEMKQTSALLTIPVKPNRVTSGPLLGLGRLQWPLSTGGLPRSLGDTFLNFGGLLPFWRPIRLGPLGVAQPRARTQRGV